MNTEPVTNAVAAFLRLFRPVYMSPIQITAAVQHIPLGAAIRNRNFQCTAFTGFIGTGLVFSAFYSFNGGPHKHKASNTFTPVQWFEYADYVPPVMDLFAEDQVPFGVSPMLSCHKDSEHLEHAFDLLRYRYLQKKLGVPSVVELHHLPHSGSSDSTSGENYDYESKTSYPNPYHMAMNSTWSPPVSDDEEYNEEPVWTVIDTACVIVAFILIVLLAKPSQRRPPSKPSTTLKWEIQEASSGNESDDDDRDCAPGAVKEQSSRLEDTSAPDGFAARFYALQDALFSSRELQNMAESFPRDLAGFTRLVVFGAAIFTCVALRVTGFVVTGHFGRRGLRQLVQEFKDANPSESTLAMLYGLQEFQQLIEKPERQEIEPLAGGSGISSPTKPSDIGDDTGSGTQVIDRTHVGSAIREAYEGTTITTQPSPSTSTSAVETHLAPVVKEERFVDEGIVMKLATDPPCPTPTSTELTDIVDEERTWGEEAVTPYPSCSTSHFSTLSDASVETLAPVVEEEIPVVEDDGGTWTVMRKRRGGRRGKNFKAMRIASEEQAQANIEEPVEPVSSLPSTSVKVRKRDRRGHGQGGRRDE